MNRILNRIGLAAAVLLTVSTAANAQCVLTPTTLSAAVADGRTQTFVVASATPNSTTTCSGANVAAGNSMYVDRELVSITAVNSTTVSVIRGQGGTQAQPHSSGALVFVGKPQFFSNFVNVRKCTRTSEAVLPIFSISNGASYDCLNGTLAGGGTNGTAVSAPFRIMSPNPGATAYTSIETNGVAGATTSAYCTEVNVTSAKLLTGIAVLNGTTVGTDKRVMILYDAGGNALANSATAGTTTATSSVYQAHAFTATYFAVPGRYLGCMQINGTTDTTRHSITGANDNIIAGAVTGQTFGTVATITAPTTYTTATGAYIYLY